MKRIVLSLFAAIAAAAYAFAAEPAGGARTNGVLCLTFDDRNWERWVAAMPLFEKYGAHASFFPHGHLDARALECLAALHGKGHTVGPHTLRHADAPAYFAERGAEAYWNEQVKPQMDAFAKVGIVPASMAYPNNLRTDETDEFLAKKGFRHFRAGNRVRPYDKEHAKLATLKPLAEADEAYMKREALRGTRLLRGVGIGEAYNTDIDDICAGIRRAAERGEAIVFYSHDITPDAATINMKTAWLEKMLATAKDAGMDILGFDDL